MSQGPLDAASVTPIGVLPNLGFMTVGDLVPVFRNGQATPLQAAVFNGTNAALYDIAMNCPGGPLPSSIFLAFITLRAFTLPLNCAGSLAVFTTGPSSPLTVTLSKTGVSFGSIAFAAVTPSPGVITSSAEAFAIGDILELSVGAATFGAADLAVTFAGTRT